MVIDKEIRTIKYLTMEFICFTIDAGTSLAYMKIVVTERIFFQTTTKIIQGNDF